METESVVLGTAAGAWPLLGHGPAMYRRPLRFLKSLPAQGELVRIQLGPTPVIVVCDPDLTDRMLREDHVYDKGGPLFDKARESMGNGLVTCPHADHRRQRRLCQPAFHPGRLPGYARVMADQIGRLVDGWQPGRTVDVMAELYGLTGRVAVQTMFGADLPLDVQNRGLADLRTVVEGTYIRMLVPNWVNRLPTPGNRRYDRARAGLRSSIGRIAADRRARQGDLATENSDLLAALLSAHDDWSDIPDVSHVPDVPDAPGGSGPSTATLTNAEIIDQVLTFFMAGTETTASALAWALHLLAGHPDVEARLHEELDRVLDGREPTVADVPQLSYTAHIVTETLRLYPPGWFFTRSTAVDCDFGGVHLAAGTTVAYSPYLIHRLGSLYQDPDRFDPSRWEGPGVSAARPAVRGAFVAFAAGRRKCIGEDFAFTEAVLALAAICRRWRLRPAPGARVRPTVGATMAPRGLLMVPSPRSAPS